MIFGEIGLPLGALGLTEIKTLAEIGRLCLSEIVFLRKSVGHLLMRTVMAGVEQIRILSGVVDSFVLGGFGLAVGVAMTVS